MTKQRIRDDGDLRRWFYQTPNIVDDMSLSLGAHRLYCHYKRVCGAGGGSCDEGSRKTAAKCNMSVGLVSNAKRELFEAGLIDVHVVKRGNRTCHRVTVVDIWEQNWKRFSKTESVTVEEIKNAIKRDSGTDYFTEQSVVDSDGYRSDSEQSLAQSPAEQPTLPERSPDEATQRSPRERKNNIIERTVEDSEKQEEEIDIRESRSNDQSRPATSTGRSPSAINIFGQPIRVTPKPPPRYDSAWFGVVGHFREARVHPTHFSNVEFVSFKDGILTLWSDNNYTRQYLINQQAAHILKMYGKYAGDDKVIRGLRVESGQSDEVLEYIAVEAAVAASNLPSKPAAQHVKLNQPIMEKQFV